MSAAVTGAGPVVAGHQPNFFPWFGYFEKMMMSDIFVFSDDVRYPKQSVVNGVEIPVGDGTNSWRWSLPVQHGGDERIADKRYVKDEKQFRKVLRAVEVNLGGLPHYADVAGLLGEFAEDFWKFDSLADLNIANCTRIARRLGIATETRRGTELGLEGWRATERLIRRLQVLGSTIYLSGAGASGYTRPELFAQAGLELRIIEYSLGPRLFGPELKYSVLVGIGRLGVASIREAVAAVLAQRRQGGVP